MKKALKTFLELAVVAGLAYGMIKLLQHYTFTDEMKPDTLTEKVIFIAGIILMALVVLAVHELGHLVAGLAQGFRFELFVVGPLGIRREGEKAKLYLNKNLGFYGGVAATSPRDDDPANARRFANVLLAGPVASLLFAAFCGAIAVFLDGPLGLLMMTGAAISVAIFFATTIPSRTGMFFTDRKRYQRLIRTGKDQEVELALLRIMGRFSQDNSYRNVREEDIELLRRDEDPYIRFMGLFNLMCFQLEKQGAIEEQLSEEYQLASEGISKNMVKAFDVEIEKYRQQVAASA